METGLAGRTVVVTGGNANIGKGISLAFAAEGANVVIVARDEAQGRRVLEEAVERGAKDTLWHTADVTDRAQVVDMVRAVHQRFGAIDVLVNNVGGNVDVDRFVDSDPTTWERDLALTVTSMLNCTHAVLPRMIERASGRIINIGSMSAIIGDPLLAVYSAGKGAVHSFTKVLAKEVGKQGITVNAIAPFGTFPDDWENDLSSGSRWHPDGVLARAKATQPEKMAQMGGRRTAVERRTARPSEIGAAAVYLASDAAAFVTAHILVIDGGVHLG
jgi:2-hydroxycyclohexanecarboxyl-CoA dehydrogenase